MRFAGSLGFQIADTVSCRDIWIAYGVPGRVVRAVQNPGQHVAALHEYAVKAGAEPWGLNFLRIRRAHGRERVGEDQSDLQVIDLAVELQVLAREVAPIQIEQMPI